MGFLKSYPAVQVHVHGPQFQGAVLALLFSFSYIADYAAKQLTMPFLGQYNQSGTCISLK